MSPSAEDSAVAMSPSAEDSAVAMSPSASAPAASVNAKDAADSPALIAAEDADAAAMDIEAFSSPTVAATIDKTIDVSATIIGLSVSTSHVPVLFAPSVTLT